MDKTRWEPYSHALLDELIVEYRIFWQNACKLSAQIARTLPSLTLHDEKHFFSLWQRADVIAGPNYLITPLEAFVFGSAILLHDAANSVAAFPGGLSEIQANVIWQDAEADWAHKHEHNWDEKIPNSAQDEILFNTLRELHAQRATSLAWLKVGSGPEERHLLQDERLRHHCGEIIGLIAASHHWNSSDLEKLPKFKGALDGMPSEWSVRPIVLACLLRCADAVQVDQSRAPDFLLALLNIRGVSRDHWVGQNRLSIPFVLPEDPKALCFTSTKSFSEEDVAAWWVARDALAVADLELKKSDELLRDLRLAPFAIDHIRDASSTERISSQILTDGWRPISAEVRISNVSHVVSMFGGAALYGYNPIVALRELIQNSIDAIQQRRKLDDDFQGSITIQVEPDGDGEHIFIIVDDDGIGMSEAVLTGPLIDFGASYAGSTLMRKERPGLMARRAPRIGRYGIGFFSVFMISSDVSVTSRNFDSGIDSFLTLKFKNGLLNRPILKTTGEQLPGARISTRVRLRVNRTTFDKLRTVSFSLKEYIVSLPEAIGALCPMADVDIFVVESGRKMNVHKRDWHKGDLTSWLLSIFPGRVYIDAFNDKERSSLTNTLDQDYDGVMGKMSQHIRLICDTHPQFGAACIIGSVGYSLSTVGGLRTELTFGSVEEKWSGVIDHVPTGATRHVGPILAPADALAKWASLQAHLATQANFAPKTLNLISSTTSIFAGDITDTIRIRINNKWRTAQEVSDILISGEQIFCPIFTLTGYPSIVDLQYTVIKEYLRVLRMDISYFGDKFRYKCTTLEHTPSSALDHNPDRELSLFDIEPNGYGLLDILITLCDRRNYTLDISYMDNHLFATYVGKAPGKLGLKKPYEVRGDAMRLTAYDSSSQ
ncbi:ATP-binding protein [Pleomorphomonas sp. PLEO]|uniref:HD domain-containing protein n=1 Tax=Pleomorphomonas sp. PLEO TaxID=3239306 RepID=UPI00351F7956